MEQTASNLVKGITDFQNHQRWYEFNQLYRPMIRKILRDKGLRPDEMDDVVQEIYLSMLSTIERFQYDRSKGKFRSWLSKIAQRAVSAHRARQGECNRLRRRQSEVPVDPHVLAESQLTSEQLGGVNDERLQLCLKLARSRFDERTWLPFYLRVIEETPIKDVEQITNMNRNAIYQSVHRVKQCLREMLSQLDNECQDQ